ncbi:hypothetical protein NRIC_38310 [Enterococcus florum]|uniref:3-hydroxy-3-methylglutaryl coenzyme A reductase n=1 Tax=Enterococcus florum TaxID=2480627 RepID=A0A4P5PCR8_9ENTE|nr:hydroxymethylglutaryl-CoA reductase, degradative [Enterococcus florum]GCF95940.1 hypothetical protein NRIC_38310 [Enterococcus florum]
MAQLVKEGKLTSEEAELLRTHTVLPDKIANNLIENQISETETPLGLARNFVINQKEREIPMATEEPSVIAAASNAAKIIGRAGGFTTKTFERTMMGQIVLRQVTDFSAVKAVLEEHRLSLFAAAERAYPSIYQRGGGLRSLQWRSFEADGYLSIDLQVDVQDAMGANIVNTMAEGIAQEIRQLLSESEILFSILSNYADHSLVEASCRVPLKMIGAEVAERIAAAAEYAKLDPYRAATHNKGIMNGIDAVVLATGNDTRAVAASVHAYAAKDGEYRGLTDWEIVDDTLIGRLRIPIAIGIVGGATKVLPKAQLSLKLLGVETAEELAEIIVAVGLAQNFAAVRALVTDGIQKGHMALQSRSLAITAGATEQEIPLVVKRLKRAKQMNLAEAADILRELRK